MRKFGLIGNPLGHSFSKKYFTEKFKNEHIKDCSYENYPLINLNRFQELITSNPDLSGLNVTIPYKTEIMKYIDVVDPEASEIGAVNVLKIRRLPDMVEIKGYNTDIVGIRETLLPNLTGVRNTLILGTGGSSMAVCYVIKKLGLDYKLVSRKKKNDVLEYQEVTAEVLKAVELIVNTTPLGMYPDIESKPELNYDLLNEKHILFDLVYNPEITSFLKMGQERGCKIISGLKMLRIQAEKSWEIWNDDNL